MDDQLLSMLGRALHSLESDAVALDELIVPQTPSSGENAGKAAQRGKSKPPVVVSVLDVKLETEALLSGWCRELRVAWPEKDLDVTDDSIAGTASFLNRHLLLLEPMAWAQMCAEEIVAQSRFVSDLVMPPASESDPHPLEVGGVREIVAWACNLGEDVSARTVYRWVKSEQLPSETAPDGRVLIRLDDLLQKCRDLRYSSVTQQGS